MKRMDWNADLGRIVLSFSYDEMLIEEVKSIAGRKWHRDHKFWSVPLESAGEAARVLIPLGFETAKDLEKLLTGVIPFEEINAGFDRLHHGEVARQVILF